MKIKSKLTLLSSLFLILLVLAIAGAVVFSIQRNAEEEIKRYRAEEMSRAKAELRDKVKMVYDMIETEYKVMRSKENIQERYGKRVKNVVEVAMAELHSLQNQVERGELTLAQAQTIAKEEIAEMQYDGNTGYFWINDTGKPFPRMIMHPKSPELTGKVLDDKKWNSALGRNANLFVSFVNITEKQGAGFVDYQWPKPTKDGKLTKMQPKISYVSLFKPWNWIIGTGIYVDDAEADGIDAIEQQITSLRYDKGEGYFFILSDELPFPKVILHPVIPALEGRLMNDAKWNNIALNGTEHLFTALIKKTRNPLKEGFVDYVWTKPTPGGVTKNDVPKLSFVKAFKPLGWVIGTGIYTDSIDQAVALKKQQVDQQVKELVTIIVSVAAVILLISLLASYLFASSLSKALTDLTNLAREISLGKGLDEEIESKSRKDEIGQLARAIECLQTSVKIMMKRIKRD